MAVLRHKQSSHTGSSLKCVFCRLDLGQGEKVIFGNMKEKPMTKAFRLAGRMLYRKKVNMEKESAEMHAISLH